MRIPHWPAGQDRASLSLVRHLEGVRCLTVCCSNKVCVCLWWGLWAGLRYVLWGVITVSCWKTKRGLRFYSWFSLTTSNTSIVSGSRRISKHNENSRSVGWGFGAWGGCGHTWGGKTTAWAILSFLGNEFHTASPSLSLCAGCSNLSLGKKGMRKEQAPGNRGGCKNQTSARTGPFGLPSH